MKSENENQDVLDYMIDQAKASEEEPGIVESIARQPMLFAKAFASKVAGTPGDFQNMLFNLMSYISEGDPQEVMPEVEKMLEGLPYFNPQTSSKIKSNIEENIPYTAAREGLEQTAEEGYELFSENVNPLTGAIGKGRAAIGAVAGMGAKALAESEGLGEYGDLAKQVANIISLTLKGGVKPENPEAIKKLLQSGEKVGVSESLLKPLRSHIGKQEELKNIYDIGTELGLSEKDLAMAMKGEKSAQTLSKMTSGRESVLKSVTEAKSNVGKIYDPIKAAGRGKKLDTSAANDLVKELEVLRHDALNLPGGREGLSPTAKDAVKKLDVWISSIKKKNPDIEQSINLHQRINSDVDWDAVFGKGKPNPLAGANKIIQSAISKTDPKIGIPFQYTNKMYGNMAELKKIVESRANKEFISDAKLVPILGFLHYMFPGSAAPAFVVSKSTPWIAEKFLTDPKYQNILSKTTKAMAQKSPKLAQAAYSDFEKQVKEDAPQDIIDEIFGKD